MKRTVSRTKKPADFTRLLIESILSQDFIRANKLLNIVLYESQKSRQNNARLIVQADQGGGIGNGEGASMDDGADMNDQADYGGEDFGGEGDSDDDQGR